VSLTSSRRMAQYGTFVMVGYAVLLDRFSTASKRQTISGLRIAFRHPRNTLYATAVTCGDGGSSAVCSMARDRAVATTLYAGPMADVDDVWKQMLADDAPVSRAAITALQSRKEPAKKPATRAAAGARGPARGAPSSTATAAATVRAAPPVPPSAMDEEDMLAAGVSAVALAAAAGGDGEPAAAAVAAPTRRDVAGYGVRFAASFATVEELETYLQRDVNCISDASPAVRCRALERLLSCLFPADDVDEAATSVLRQFFPAVMKPLLKRFADPSEKCRELSLRLVRGVCGLPQLLLSIVAPRVGCRILCSQVSRFVDVLLDLSSALPYLVPALMERAAARVSYDVDQMEFVEDLEGTSP
jgi:hypothetical protein